MRITGKKICASKKYTVKVGLRVIVSSMSVVKKSMLLLIWMCMHTKDFVLNKVTSISIFIDSYFRFEFFFSPVKDELNCSYSTNGKLFFIHF